MFRIYKVSIYEGADSVFNETLYESPDQTSHLTGTEGEDLGENVSSGGQDYIQQTTTGLTNNLTFPEALLYRRQLLAPLLDWYFTHHWKVKEEESSSTNRLRIPCKECIHKNTKTIKLKIFLSITFNQSDASCNRQLISSYLTSWKQIVT